MHVCFRGYFLFIGYLEFGFISVGSAALSVLSNHYFVFFAASGES